MLYVMSRLSPLADEMMLAEERAAAAELAGTTSGGSAALSTVEGEVQLASDAQHAEFMSVIAPAYKQFVSATMASTMEKCKNDVAAMTRYVSWDFQVMLPDGPLMGRCSAAARPLLGRCSTAAHLVLSCVV